LDYKSLTHQSSLQKYADYLRGQGLSQSSIDRKLSSLSTFNKFLIANKYISDPNTPKNPQKNTVIASVAKQSFSKFQQKYILFSIIVLLVASLGAGIYTQFILKATRQLAYTTANNPIRAARTLSFRVD
jgi:integrase